MTPRKRWRNGAGEAPRVPLPPRSVNFGLVLRFRRMATLVSTFLRGRSVDEALALTGVQPLAAVVYAFDVGLHRAARRILCEYRASQEHRPHRCCQNCTR